jgi:hypothetical protein
MNHRTRNGEPRFTEVVARTPLRCATSAFAWRSIIAQITESFTLEHTIKGEEMRQAIVTKYFGPTNHRGSRVRATAHSGSLMMIWDDSLSSDANHDRAARQLADKFNWRGDLIAGGLPGGDANVYVFDDTGES